MATPENETEPAQAPTAGLRLMVVIVISMALVAIYANVQKARRDKIETATITPASPAPSASPVPNQ
jgi:hypothetical protein